MLRSAVSVFISNLLVVAHAKLIWVSPILVLDDELQTIADSMMGLVRVRLRMLLRWFLYS